MSQPADIRYVDCRLSIRNDRETTYRDDYHSPIEGRVRDGENNDRLVRETIERLHAWVADDRRFTTRRDLELLGRHLYHLLFDDAVRNAFEQSYDGFRKNAQNARLRLMLAFHEEAKELSAFPWEFLFMPRRGSEPGFFISAEKRTELILTRFVPDSTVTRTLAPERSKLKVLMVFASPHELPGLDAAEVFDSMTALDDRIEVKRIKRDENPEGLTKDGLAAAIDDFQPHILHFIGHGDVSRGIALLKTPAELQEQYDLGRGNAEAEWVDGRALNSLLGRNVPRLVFLHACQGATADHINGFNSMARDLVYSYGVPAVIAMQYVITNESAGLFAQTFYQQIASGKRIDLAVSEGRWALRQSRDGEFSDRGFGTPLVYLQDDSAIVLHTLDDADEPEPQVEGVDKLVPCPYRDGCRGQVMATDTVCVPCGRPIGLCEEGHVMAAERPTCPQGHPAAARSAASAQVQSEATHANGGRFARSGHSTAPPGVTESQREGPPKVPNVSQDRS